MTDLIRESNLIRQTVNEALDAKRGSIYLPFVLQLFSSVMFSKGLGYSDLFLELEFMQREGLIKIEMDTEPIFRLSLTKIVRLEKLPDGNR